MTQEHYRRKRTCDVILVINKRMITLVNVMLSHCIVRSKVISQNGKASYNT
jgi:hypothetical protein